MKAKWILRGVMIASVLVSYNCKRRNNNDGDNTENNNNNNNAPVVQQPNTPNVPQQGMPQQGMPQQGMPQQGMPQPQQGMPQQGMPQPQQGMQPMQPAQPGGGDFIATQLQMRQQQFAAGMNPVMPMARGTLQTSGTQNYSVPLQANHCYKIIGVGGMGVTDLDLKLFDPTNNQVDADVATDNFPVIGLQRPLCPTTPGQYRLEVVMYAGAGEFGVQVFGN